MFVMRIDFSVLKRVLQRIFVLLIKISLFEPAALQVFVSVEMTAVGESSLDRW